MVGVNAAIVAMAQGIGFSIPANTARWVVSQLLTHGRVRRGTLGLTAQQVPLNRQLARYHHLQNNSCVQVVAINELGAAYIAGIREGDRLVSINGQPVENVEDVHGFLAEWPIGKAIQVVLLRGTELGEFEMVPGEAVQ